MIPPEKAARVRRIRTRRVDYCEQESNRRADEKNAEMQRLAVGTITDDVNAFRCTNECASSRYGKLSAFGSP
jgi:hypothetical protein